MLGFASRVLVGLALVAAVAGTATAQDGFSRGYTDLGITIGVGGIEEASNSFGARFEKAVGQLPSLGNGLIGIQVAFDYYFWDFGLGYKWQYLPFGVSANYHFSGSNRFDPFIGLGVGYAHAMCGGPKWVWGDCSGYGSEVYPIARVGARYFVKDRTAIYVDAGAGNSIVNAGFTVRIK